MTAIFAAVFAARVGQRHADELARNIAQVLVLEPLSVRYVVRETLRGRRLGFGPGSPWGGFSDTEISTFAAECERRVSAKTGGDDDRRVGARARSSSRSSHGTSASRAR